MFVSQPVLTKTVVLCWFYAGVEVSISIALLSEGAGSMLRELAVILHLK